MKSKLTKLSFALACLILAVSSTVARAQMKDTPTSGVNVLLIHGRAKPSSSNEIFGVWRTDQMNYWGGNKTLTSGTVWYVQWDAWGEHFNSTTASPAGGQWEIQLAVNHLCNADAGQRCYIICHSAGCAAFENYLATSNYSSNSIYFIHVLAAASAAGGSELANSHRLNQVLKPFGLSGAIDDSLATGYARNQYNHNNMQGVKIRGLGGTVTDGGLSIIVKCSFFPEQVVEVAGIGVGAWNRDCTTCSNDGGAVKYSQCADTAVALHSSCGHSRAASFQDCNSTLPGHDDTAGTYDYHGWWIDDSGWSGPYSPLGKPMWNSSYHTYRTDHTGGKKLGIDEYSDAPFSLAP